MHWPPNLCTVCAITAGGFGQYKVVGYMSSTFTATYDPSAYVLVWINVVLAGVSSVMISAAIFAVKQQERTKQKAVIALAGPSFRGSMMRRGFLSARQVGHGSESSAHELQTVEAQPDVDDSAVTLAPAYGGESKV